MKPVKSFSLLAAVAVIAMALFGPSTAIGETTALCKADESPCSSSSLVSHVHYVAKDLEVLTSAMNYKCEALFLGTVNELGAPQVMEGEFTYTSCNQGCERKEVNGPSVFHLLKTGHESAELIGTEGSGIFSFCAGFIECVYSFEELTGLAKGPLLSTESNGEITYVEQELQHTSGFLCPEIAKLDAKFVPLSANYISS